MSHRPVFLALCPLLASALVGAGIATLPIPAAADDRVSIDILLTVPAYEARRHVHESRVGSRRFKDGKSEYKYDDGVIKIEEKIDRRADKYEYKYEGPDGKCEEKYDAGKYEYKCE